MLGRNERAKGREREVTPSRNAKEGRSGSKTKADALGRSYSKSKLAPMSQQDTIKETIRRSSTQAETAESKKLKKIEKSGSFVDSTSSGACRSEEVTKGVKGNKYSILSTNSQNAKRVKNGADNATKLDSIEEIGTGQQVKTPNRVPTANRLRNKSKTVIQTANNAVRITNITSNRRQDLNSLPYGAKSGSVADTPSKLSPFSVADNRPLPHLQSKFPFKDSKQTENGPSTQSRFNKELEDLYAREEFYDFNKFFDIPKSTDPSDPFANIDVENDDNFTIDSADYNISSGDSEEEAPSPQQKAKSRIGNQFNIKPAARLPAVKAKPKEADMEDGEGDEEGEEGGVKSSWYKDELKVIGKDQKGSMKKLYKDKIACITLKKSYYKDRHLVFFVNYPDYVVESYKKLDKLPIKLPKESSPEYLNIIEEDSNRVGVTLYYPHPDSLVKFTPYTFMKKFSVPFAKVGKSYKTIKYIMKNNGFILTQAKKYNFCWGFSKHRKQVYDLEGCQKFSHFSGCWQVGRKDHLWQNLNRKQKIHPKLYDFVPLTFVLKTDYEAFCNFKMKRNYWILKPVDAARGEGIRVASKTEQIKQDTSRTR